MNNFEMLSWLAQHGDKWQKPEEWCKLFSIRIVDDDGWRNYPRRSFTDPIGLMEFVNRVNVSTIFPA